MISNTLKFSSNINMVNDPISEQIKSFQMQRPVNRSLLPKWDFAFVLSFLCKEPFKPLSKASLIHLSMKKAFLSTMQGGHAHWKTGKTGKMVKKKSLQGKIREFEILLKIREKSGNFKKSDPCKVKNIHQCS